MDIEDDDELLIPLVLWNESPKVEITCMHVHYLSIFQPSSQNSTSTSRLPTTTITTCNNSNNTTPRASFTGIITSLAPQYRRVVSTGQRTKDEEEDEEEDQYQVCVFAGTLDGMILYWLFEQERVQSLSILMPNGSMTSNNSKNKSNSVAIQGIVCGIDEWGQSMMVSITKDGALGQWQLPNGVCSSLNQDLLREIAPIKGMQMFCNKRYAMVYSEESRMIALDTWKMTLLYCIDTAQEQVRRSLAVGEIKFILRGTNQYHTHRPTSTTTSTTSGSGDNTTATSASCSPLVASKAIQPINTSSMTQPWDSIVLSLGAEGLVKCFLWSKPRGGASGGSGPSSSTTTASIGSTGSSGTYQWYQESCWILSWADDAEDITCSQSTSLKDGDNMNPQSALMRSIKNSYFPIGLKLSSDCSLILFIWGTKWAVLQRQWLCHLGPNEFVQLKNRPGLGGQAEQGGASCRVPPGVFLGLDDPTSLHQQEASSSSSSRRRGYTFGENTRGSHDMKSSGVRWVDGEFVDETHVLLWTNTGHVIQFDLTTNAASSPNGEGIKGQGQPNGQLFIFTKELDQFVPRSNYKPLGRIERGRFVSFVQQCSCCSSMTSSSSSLKSSFARHVLGGTRASGGLTNCIIQRKQPRLGLIHVCRRGSVGFWHGDLVSNYVSSSRNLPLVLPIDKYKKIKFNSIADGYDERIVAEESQIHRRRQKRTHPTDTKDRITIAHLILGRDQCGTSTLAFEGSGTSSIRNNCTNYSSLASGGIVAATSGSSVPPVVEKRSSASLGLSMSSPSTVSTAAATQRPSSPSPLTMALAGEVMKHLQDVPILVIGYKDGSIEFSLLKDPLKATSSNTQQNTPEEGNTYSTVYCHESKVTCITHCNWISLPTPAVTSMTMGTSPVQDSPSLATGTSAPPVPISMVTAHRRSSNDNNIIANAQGQGQETTTQAGGHYMSMKKARYWKRGVPVEESCLATDRNPFYRPSFSTQVAAAFTGNNNNNNNNNNSRAVSPVPSPPTLSSTTTLSNGKMSFVVFTGASNGSMCIVEVVLRHHFYGNCDKEDQPSLDQRFVLETKVIGRFMQHVDTIVQICISPALKEEDKLVASIGKDRKVSIYAPNIVYPLAQATKNQAPLVEWECILELCDHGDTIVGLEWHLEMGLLYVECTDGMMYIWNLDTGILERTVPISLLHHPIERNWSQPASQPFNTIHLLANGSGGSSQAQVNTAGRTISHKKKIRLPVECKNILIGGKASVHICKYFIQRSAEHIKKTWKTHYYAVNIMASSFLKAREQTEQKIQMTTEENTSDIQLKIPIPNAPSSSSTSNFVSSLYDSSLDSPSPYAIESMEMILFSFLLSWGANHEIDRACMDLLGLAKPKWLYSCALIGTAGALTLPVPWKMYTKQSPSQPPQQQQQRPQTTFPSSRTANNSSIKPLEPESPAFYRHWQHSSALTANLSLGIVSLCMNLMEHKFSLISTESNPSSITCGSPRNKEAFQLLWSQLITQQSIFLPEHVFLYREPSLEILAKYGFGSCEYTQLASRLLLNAVIKRLDSSIRSALTAEFAAKLHFEIVRLEAETNSKILSTSTSITTMMLMSNHSNTNSSSSNNPHHSSIGIGLGSNSGGGTTSGTSGGSGTSNVHLMTTLIDGSLVVKRLGPLVMLLSVIGTCFPGEISPAGAREVCDILVYLLKSPKRKVANVAAELLTKGLLLFRPHLVDLSSLIYQLLMIDAREKELVNGTTGQGSCNLSSNVNNTSSGNYSTSQLPLRGNNSCKTTVNSNAAMNLLVELGACESAFVLTLLQQEINHTDRSQAYRECILIFLTELINTHFLLMYRHLPAVVDTIMCCLDPTKPERRKKCLELSTKCLHQLVRRFPMVDFHRETQRLAIGTMEAVILIYDLRTATKWRVFDGHTSAISSICFRSDGQMIVSYAAREASVRWWNCGNAGIFGGMLKMQQTCLKEHKLDVIRQDWSVGSTTGSNGSVSSFGMNMGVGGGGNVAGAVASAADLKQVIQTCRFQFVTLKDKKMILRLTREDASQIQFQL